jgi:hypothetical protein
MEATCLPDTTQFLLVPAATSHEMTRSFKGNGLTTSNFTPRWADFDFSVDGVRARP